MATWDADRLDQLFQRLKPHVGSLNPTKTGKLWTRPRVPAQIVREMARMFAPDAEPLGTVAVCDTTQLQRARAGFLITGGAFYCKAKGGEAKTFRFSDLQDAVLEGKRTKKEDARTLRVSTAHGELRFAPADADLNALRGLVTAILEARDEGLTDDVERYLIVRDLPPEALKSYLRLVVAQARVDGRDPQPREWAEAQVLMTQLGIAPALRAEVATSLDESSNPADEPLEAVTAGVPEACHRALYLSLVKDVLRVLRAARPGAALGDWPYVRGLIAHCGITEDQVAAVVDASALDEMLLSTEAEPDAVAARAQELSERADELEAPLAAAFLSGTQHGLSTDAVATALSALDLAPTLGVTSLATASGKLLLLKLAADDDPGDDAPSGDSSAGSGPTAAAIGRERRKLLRELVHGHDRTQRSLTEELAVSAEAVAKSGGKAKQLERLASRLTLWCDALDVVRERSSGLAERVLAELTLLPPPAAEPEAEPAAVDAVEDADA